MTTLIYPEKFTPKNTYISSPKSQYFPTGFSNVVSVNCFKKGRSKAIGPVLTPSVGTAIDKLNIGFINL